MTGGELAAAVHARIEALFERDADVFGADLAPYRGHAQRVAGLVAQQVKLQPDWVDLVAVASYHHDSAIWFDQTWDYLPQSIEHAQADLADAPAEQVALAADMINEHHRLRRARQPHPLVEAMRRADAADVYRVVLPPGVSREQYRDLLRRFPDAGLHAMLARGFLLGLRERRRLNPMPMLKF